MKAKEIYRKVKGTTHSNQCQMYVQTKDDDVIFDDNIGRVTLSKLDEYLTPLFEKYDNIAVVRFATINGKPLYYWENE